MTELKANDPDRYLTGLFAPPEHRIPLFALYVLNTELARITSRTREPIAGLIRFQWWRDGIDSAAGTAPLQHPVLNGLRIGLAAGSLAPSDLLSIVSAREAKLDGQSFTRAKEALAIAESTGGSLQVLAARILGTKREHDLDAANDIGTAFSIVRIMTSLTTNTYHASDPLLAELTVMCQYRLRSRRVTKTAITACLLAPIARSMLRSLKQGQQSWKRPALMPLRLYLAAILGRV